MSKCDNCRLRKASSQAFDIHWLGEEDCPYDVCPEIKTNGDRIRAMSDEELADELLEWFACFYAIEWSREQIINYLKQEAAT